MIAYTIKNPQTGAVQTLRKADSTPAAVVYSLVRESFPGWVFIKA